MSACWRIGTAGRELYTDEYRQPCTAENLADAMLELCERNDVRGVFHWAAPSSFRWYDLGCRIRTHFKLLLGA
jgi:dTDP-4-dehydrorhamnose reductase